MRITYNSETDKEKNWKSIVKEVKANKKKKKDQLEMILICRGNREMKNAMQCKC